MARLCEARHFYLNMKSRLFFALSALLAAVSCNNSPKVVTYQDAERQFIASLTAEDTLMAQVLCQDYMECLVSGNVSEAVDMLNVLENSVLYKMGSPSTDLLVRRYTADPVTSWGFESFSLSTPGNNKVVCKYATGGDRHADSGLKIVFNPVKVEGKWYLTLKEGPFEVHPLAPAPDTLKLHKKQ